MPRRSRRLVSLVLAALALAVGGFLPLTAGAVGTPVASPTGGQPDCVALLTPYGGQFTPGQACVSVVVAVPDAPSTTIYVDGVKTPALSVRPFASNVTVGMDAGKRRLQATVNATGLDAAVLDTKVTLKAGRAYEIVVFGPLAKIRLKTFPVDLTPVAKDAVRVRAINAARELGTVDVAFAPSGSAASPADVVFRTVKYGTASDYVMQPVAATTQLLQLYAAGTHTAGPSIDGVSCLAGTVCSYVLVGVGGREPDPQVVESEFFTQPLGG